MARFMRVVRQGRWSRPTWISLNATEWQADALGDLQTSKNELSLFLVDTQEATNHVVAGLAANRQNVANVDYAIIDDTLLSTLNLRTIQKDAETPHFIANQLHYNIENLTAKGIFKIMQSISAEDITRVHPTRCQQIAQTGH